MRPLKTPFLACKTGTGYNSTAVVHRLLDETVRRWYIHFSDESNEPHRANHRPVHCGICPWWWILFVPATHYFNQILPKRNALRLAKNSPIP